MRGWPPIGWLIRCGPLCPSHPVIPVLVWCSRSPSGLGFDWCAQVVRRDLVGRIFRCSDRGLLLGRFGIGAQLGIGERGMYYYIVVHTDSLRKQLGGNEIILGLRTSEQSQQPKIKGKKCLQPTTRLETIHSDDEVEETEPTASLRSPRLKRQMRLPK